MSFFILLITLTALIFVHELGHLMAARLIGVKVRTISIGFGRSLYSYHDRTGTLWKLSIFPLGGFVQLDDDDNNNSDLCNQSPTKFFNSCSLIEKSFVALAGPFANIILAFLLIFSVTFVSGFKLLPVIGSIGSNLTTEFNGLKENDKFVAINGSNVNTFNEIDSLLKSKLLLDEKVSVKIMRDDYLIEFDLKFNNETRKTIIDEGIAKVGLSPGINGFRVENVKADSIGEKIGFKKNDLIFSINGELLNTVESISHITNKSSTQVFSVSRDRMGGIEKTTNVEFFVQQNENETLGLEISPHYTNQEGLSVFESLKKTGILIISFVTDVFATVGNFLSGTSIDFSSPVEAGSFVSKGISSSYSDYILTVSILSLSIGVLNLMPLPALDGGNCLIYLIEYIRGKPFSTFFLSIMQKISIAFIFFVVIVVLLIDLKNLF
ncbi:RIP metalloprotease RseP [Betaproteobacteria bacterium]|nr:RIP metalloprotease RseP [Betaproteobacteria bacterium]